MVCRAGGGVAEVLAFGKPMILVPYPFAAHRHQHRNAVYLEQEGAAEVVEDDAFDGRTFADLVKGLAADAVRRERMARASRELGRPDAADQVAREALVLAGVPR
jgi:UDP-N-acetylglucosamine--N-acetylmuramyl-(pentapeptide) pyrophosphoryl-undecaprenol N-acetylglucosamine transferase